MSVKEAMCRILVSGCQSYNLKRDSSEYTRTLARTRKKQSFLRGIVIMKLEGGACLSVGHARLPIYCGSVNAQSSTKLIFKALKPETLDTRPPSPWSFRNVWLFHRRSRGSRLLLAILTATILSLIRGPTWGQKSLAHEPSAQQHI